MTHAMRTLAGSRLIKWSVALWFCSSLANLAMASGEKSMGHLGVVGPVYSIREEDFLKYIQRRLQELQRSGKLNELNRDMKQHTERKLATLPPVAGLRTTTQVKSYYFDPTVTIPQDIKTPDGKVVARAGQRLNPLDTVTWSKQMLFFDGRDQRQVDFAARMVRTKGANIRPVLVAGNFTSLSRRWKVPVYYDQSGLLTERFGIGQVPALVYQEGKRLRVDEMVP